MHRQALDAGCLQAGRHRQVVPRGGVPAEPDLGGDRNRDRLDHGFADPAGELGIAQQGRAARRLDDLGHRAAHVDVDDIGAGRLRHPGRLRHHPGVAPHQVHRDRRLIPIEVHQPERFPMPADERLAADHLGAGQPGAELPSDLSEGRVGDARHRGDVDR